MWPGPRPTYLPSFVLIRPTVWPQYTNVTDRHRDRTDRQTGRQRTDGIGRTVIQTVAQKLEAVGQCIPPPRHVLPVSRYTDPNPDPHPDPYRHQNLIISSLAYCQPPQNFMQILWEILRKVANRETNNGENLTSLAKVTRC